MASQLSSTTAAASSGTTTTTATTCTSPISTATTVFSLSDDDLHEIFLRLPDLPALVGAALTCRPWLRAVRSSLPFRRLFSALHPDPLIGLFIKTGDASAPSFLPPRRSNPVVTAALRSGDFLLSSLPPSSTGWRLVDCRDGYVLLWNNSPDMPSLAAVNPMTWAVNVLPSLPDQISAGKSRGFAAFGFHLLSSGESPRSLRVASVCMDKRRVRAAVFTSETREWAIIGPWVYVGANCNLKFMAGTLVGGSVFWPYQGKPRMIRIDTATMGVSFVDLPPMVEAAGGHNFSIGETANGELCIVYECNFSLHVWIRRRSVEDGTEVWAPPSVHSLGAVIDQVMQALALDVVELDIKILQVRSGLVHLSTTCPDDDGTLHCCFFSLSLETIELELLLEGSFDGVAHPYYMAWPPSLVGGDDDETNGHA